MTGPTILEEPQVADETIVRPATRRKRKTRPKTKRQPPYAVMIHNDPHNGMDFVVGVLKKVFGYSTTKSIRLMLQAHVTGVARVWTGTLEVAELKADQLRSCGPDPRMVDSGASNLSVSIEPLD